MRKKYSREFKEEAISLTLSSDKPNTQIAKGLGINDKTFNNWVLAAIKKPKDIEELKLERACGTPIKDLMRKYRLSKATIYRYLSSKS